MKSAFTHITYSLPLPRLVGPANKILGTMVKELENLQPLVFSDDSFVDADDLDIINTAIVYRAKKAFSLPGNRKKTRQAAFDNFTRVEESLKSHPIPHLWDCSSESLVTRKAIAWLGRMCGQVKLDFSRALDVDFSPGETYNSLNGDVSLYAKLSRIEHWTVTPDAFDDACELIYHNAGLKACARAHFRRLRSILPETDRSLTPFENFRRRLKKVLVVVPGARGTSVSKSAETDRYINVEPLFNMLLQRCVARELRRILKICGNDLGVQLLTDISCDRKRLFKDDAQVLHAILCNRLDLATIDLKDASDRIACWLVSRMFCLCPGLRELFFRYRSPMLTLDGRLYRPYKISSMGNGFTFELMTLILLSFCRQLCSESRVYGDDIIIRRESAERLIGVLEYNGLKVNNHKSFIKSNFRESCGAFVLNGYAIRTFEIEACEEFQDILIAHNKIALILAEEGLVLYERVLKVLQQTKNALLELVPILCRGPFPAVPLRYLGAYAFEEKYLLKHKRSTIARQRWARTVVDNWQYLADTQNAGTFVVVNTPIYVPRTVKAHGLVLSLASLYSGRRFRASLRGEGRWVSIPSMVFEDGRMVLLRSIKNYDPVGTECPTEVLNTYLTALRILRG